METSDDRAFQKRANDLYWSSDDSVNDIADQLELSKGALYGLVEPLSAGLPCPRCGTEMTYPNRTAREKGHLSCPGCDLEEDEEVVRSRSGSSAEGGSGARDPRAREGEARQALHRMLLGSALLGAAAGVALTLWTRRKR